MSVQINNNVLNEKEFRLSVHKKVIHNFIAYQELQRIYMQMRQNNTAVAASTYDGRKIEVIPEMGSSIPTMMHTDYTDIHTMIVTAVSEGSQSTFHIK